MPPSVIKLVVSGAGGRMGSRIVALAVRDPGFQVLYGLESPTYKGSSGPIPIGSDAGRVADADVVIDFSSPAATLQLAQEAARCGKAMVIGTTGFKEEELSRVREHLSRCALVLSPNMSVGVNVWFRMVQETARALPSYSVRVVEKHHRHKKDSPSGTALHAGCLIESAGGRKPAFESIREGEVVGDHQVIFSGPQDRLELFHHAESRDAFAAGALVAARWVARQKPGWYSMAQVLGLEPVDPL